MHWINKNTYNTTTGALINTTNLSTYWTDGSYSLITSVTDGSIPSSVAINSKVFYMYGDHSAIVNKKAPELFWSKWGAAGLYEHPPTHAPYLYANHLQYYKKN